MDELREDLMNFAEMRDVVVQLLAGSWLVAFGALLLGSWIERRRG